MAALKHGEARPLRIAYFSPLPPQRSGIADYSAALLPHLARLAEVTVFADEPVELSTAVRAGCELRALADFPAMRHAYDLPLYHMGNSEFHDAIADYSVHYPGVLVLHDTFLHHATAQRTLGAGQPNAYLREMAYAGGAAAARTALAVQQGFAAPPVFAMPLNERLLDASLGVIVHSNFAARQVAQHGRPARLHIVPALIEELQAPSLRSTLGLAEPAVLLASFGLITAEKQIAAVLRALRRLRADGVEVHYLLAGDRAPGMPLERLIAQYGLADRVHLLGYVPDLASFAGWISAADVVINLRHPTAGETSATALRALVAGRPLLVHDGGWYAELPDAIAMKVPAQDEPALATALARLAGSPELRRQMGEAAQRYARAVHAPERVAAAYVAALQAVRDSIAPPLSHG